MYCSHFNLKKKPFQLSSDNSFLWLGNAHARALGLLKRGMNGPQRRLALTGDIGTGKTTLLHELIYSLPRETALAHITDPSLELHHLFLAIAQGLGFETLYQAGEKFAPALGAFLARKHEKGEKCYIVVDEAHLIPERFLIQLFSWSESAPGSSLTLLLAGQLEFHTLMEKVLGRDWKDRMDIHAMLSPLAETETRDYIRSRLELAGTREPIFLPDAVSQVHRFAKGIPRRINIACDQALIAAYAKGIRTVDAPTFREAVGILELPGTPAPPANTQSPSLAVQPPPTARQPAKALAGLAAALILAVLAYTFYPQPVSAPVQIPPLPPASTDKPAHSAAVTPPDQFASPAPMVPDPPAVEEMPDIPPVMAGPSPQHQTDFIQEPAVGETAGSDLEAYQAEPYEPPETEKKPAPEKTPPVMETTAPSTAEADDPPNVDAFINEVFMIKDGPPTSTAEAPSPLDATHREPEVPAPETPTEATAYDQRPGQETDPLQAPQPDPDAIIDWLLRKKAR